MRLRRNQYGSTSMEHLAVLGLVALLGVVGLGKLGGSFDAAIAAGASGAAQAAGALGGGGAGGAAGAAPSAVGPSAQAAAEHGYTVQVVAYDGDDQARAQAYADMLRNQHGYDAFVEQDGGYWVVRIHNVGSYSEADDILDGYAHLGLTGDAFVANHSGQLTPDQVAYLEAVAAADGQQPPAGDTPATETPAPDTAAPGVDDPATDEAVSDMGFPTRTVDEPTVATSEAGDAGEVKKDRGGGLFGFAKGLVSGLWDGAKSIVGGTFRMVKSIGWDFIVEDVVFGTVKGVAGAGCRLLTFGKMCQGSSFNPISSVTESLGNFWNKKGAIVDVVKGFVGNVNTCLNPMSHAAGGDRGYACGRGTADVIALIWGPKIAKGVKNFVIGKSGVAAPAVIVEGGGTATINAGRAARVLDASRRTADDVTRVVRDTTTATEAVIRNVNKRGTKILESKKPSVLSAKAEAQAAAAAGTLDSASAGAKLLARTDEIVKAALPDLASQVRAAAAAGNLRLLKELKSNVRKLDRELVNIRKALGLPE
jgi:hypothetical protein